MAAAIAAAWYAKRAAIATESTVKIAEDASAGANEALAIAGRNADAAVKLADQAEMTARKQLQAYVAAESAIFSCNDEFEKPLLKITLKNHGVTPATIIKASLGVTWYVDSETKIEAIKWKADLNFEVQPKATIIVPLMFHEDIADDLEGRLMVIGRIDFRDVFGKEDFFAVTFRDDNIREFGELCHGHRLPMMTL